MGFQRRGHLCVQPGTPSRKQRTKGAFEGWPPAASPPTLQAELHDARPTQRAPGVRPQQMTICLRTGALVDSGAQGALPGKMNSSLPQRCCRTKAYCQPLDSCSAR
eukprot:6169292-Alexandrium_andersonii.AAC.1